MSTEQNRMSATDSKTMISGGLEGIQESLKKINVDYSWWQDAFDNVTAENSSWVSSNMQVGVSESGTMDLLVIIQPDGRVIYSWTRYSGKASDPNILDHASLKALVDSLQDVPTTDVQARAQFMFVGEDLYLLSAARITPVDTTSVRPGQLPINIMGFHFHDERVAALGQSFLTPDLTVSKVVREGRMNIPLLDGDGKNIAHLTWSPPKPGQKLLAKSATPIFIVLVMFSLISVVVAKAAKLSARELANKEKSSYVAARTDGLTGLPNRFRFEERLRNQHIVAASRSGKLSILFLDLNDFKYVNDTLGHAAGDTLIRQVAQRLTNRLPKKSFLARVGGDEFTILLDAENAKAETTAIAIEIINDIQHDFHLCDKTINVSVSIGFAIADGKALPEELVRRADVAMYDAKKRRLPKPLQYKTEIETNIVKSRKVIEALRGALIEETLDVHYQPIVAAKSGELKSVEALVRWNSEELGLYPPASFIPLAEESGLIHKLGLYVFRRVCDDIAQMPDLKVSINLSPVQLRDSTLVDAFATILDETGVSAEQIEIELTEGILVTHPDIAKARMLELKRIGFSMALDDFGTGFSSIGYLRLLPFDKLKIDRSYIMDIEFDSEAAAFTQTIVNLGRALNMSVVAEGVETQEQLKIARLAGCDLIQGYLFSKPLSLACLKQWKQGPQDTLRLSS
ncbi:putative bifunctional diguanylate cyclase/phosphodiesterase [Maritalea mediterranea]|uniref:Bifunctional diguanylate cyclase/phosphodiesterase n=1 Tax=Maritalea mediterranea TaxID=2909667 RepID=A0ABS9E668_9HYPH|nr:bifunctional diguanylate cyclase/phosphodiesterase [Maritalea mediterranea]MCF4098363.1 bifunctional diguanylate cyclase/phosphodiesterase [Maritalea mediterranea]